MTNWWKSASGSFSKWAWERGYSSPSFVSALFHTNSTMLLDHKHVLHTRCRRPKTALPASIRPGYETTVHHNVTLQNMWQTKFIIEKKTNNCLHLTIIYYDGVDDKTVCKNTGSKCHISCRYCHSMWVADERFTSFSFWLAFSHPCAVFQEASSVCLHKVLAP